ncbi:hypothetical protein N9D03_01715 [Alphaproteobacteria bacterium]|nr:hypothetical protein [Alphaproteobacteria bacterium]
MARLFGVNDRLGIGEELLDAKFALVLRMKVRCLRNDQGDLPCPKFKLAKLAR